ncbi:MAG TPA: hypothetical protein VGI99_13165 [Gemmataceae bacterium]
MASALEAVEGVPVEGGEAAAGARCGSMQRAGSALLVAAAVERATEQLQDGGDRDGVDRGEVDGRPRSDSGLTLPIGDSELTLSVLLAEFGAAIAGVLRPRMKARLRSIHLRTAPTILLVPAIPLWRHSPVGEYPYKGKAEFCTCSDGRF